MDIEAILTGLATAAGAATGLHAAFPALPEAVNDLPLFAPLDWDITYHGTFGAGGLCELVVSCQVLVSRGDTAAGRSVLYGLLNSGAGTIRAAVEADKTLGGTAGTLVVEQARGAGRLYEVAGTDYLGAVFTVRIWAS